MNSTLARLSRLVEDLSRESDGCLLASFLTGNQSAFRELVNRHGTLVFGVCYRILRHQQDAEDAFQAVFIVLARRAADVWPQDAVGSWLYGVASRVALKARILRTRSSLREQTVEEIAQPDRPALEPDTAEVVDRVVRKLPEVYRAAVVACDLEGLSRKDAAWRLGWTEGTLSGRLARARKLLANRLRKAGITCPPASLAAFLGTDSKIRAELSDAVMSVVSTSSGIPATVAPLTQGVVPSIFAFKLKAIAAAVLVVSIVSLGAWTVGAGDGFGGKETSAVAASVSANGQSAGLPNVGEELKRLEREFATLRSGYQSRKAGRLEGGKPSILFTDDEPKPFPPDVIKAWEKVAIFGKIAPDEFGFPEYSAEYHFKALPLKNGELPAFSAGYTLKVSELPASEVPFGLVWAFITDEHLKQLATLKQLRWLHVHGSEKVTDAGMKELAALKQLQSLSLWDTEVTNAGLKELSALKQLKSLGLHRIRVTNAGMKELGALKQLQTLSLSDADVSDAGMKELAELKQLQSLKLAKNGKITDVGIKELSALKQLRRLSLWDTQVTDLGLKELATLKQLQSLDLTNSYDITDVGVKELSALKQLQTLHLNCTPVTDAGVKGLPTLKQLQTLDLSHTKLTDVGVKELSVMKQLQTLDLSGTNVTDAALKQLADLTQLRTLKLGGTLVRGADLEKLAALKQLQTLDLSSTLVRDLNDITVLKQLQTLDLSDTRVTDLSLHELFTLKQLQTLVLSNTRVTDAGMKKLVAHKQLEWLDLTDTNVTDVGLKELANLKQLRWLDLSGTRVTEQGVNNLRKSLPMCRIVSYTSDP